MPGSDTPLAWQPHPLQVAESQWEACILDNSPVAAPPASEGARQTTDGYQCVFPATYAGQTITACTPLEPGGPEMCRVSACPACAADRLPDVLALLSATHPLLPLPRPDLADCQWSVGRVCLGHSHVQHPFGTSGGRNLSAGQQQQQHRQQQPRPHFRHHAQHAVHAAADLPGHAGGGGGVRECAGRAVCMGQGHSMHAA